MSNVLEFPSNPGSRRPLSPSSISQSDRDFIDARIDRKLAELTPAEPIVQASVISFPGPECRVSPPQKKKRYGLDDEWHHAFGRKLREARVKAGVSIEDAAAAAGCRVETWRHYEATGRGRLMYPLRAFAMRYRIRLDDIFDGAEAALRQSAD